MRPEYEFDVKEFEDPNSSDKSANVRFFIQPVLNEAKSAEAGRPIFEDKEYCEIVVPGNKTNRPIKPVNDIVKRRFAYQYRQWKLTGEAEPVSGTILAEVPWLTRSQVEELSYYHIRTLEQLANVGDDICGKIMGLYDLKRRAGDHLKRAEEAAPVEHLRAELASRDEKINALEVALKDQAEIIKKLKEQLED